jgi:hypothetical protein
MIVLVKYLKGFLKGRTDMMSYGSALAAEKNGFVEIIKKSENKIDARLK